MKWAAKTAHEYSVALERTIAVRRQMGKEELPQVVYTTEEWKQLKEYALSRDIGVKDDRAAARLQSTRIMASAELRDAHAKSEAFETSRHFWKFDVEGWGKMSLREAEAKIKQHTEEKFKLYDFLRSSKRASILCHACRFSEFLSERAQIRQRLGVRSPNQKRRGLGLHQEPQRG